MCANANYNENTAGTLTCVWLTRLQVETGKSVGNKLEITVRDAAEERGAMGGAQVCLYAHLSDL
eukprot:1187077-Prorocentrum_minimum.AAC.3